MSGAVLSEDAVAALVDAARRGELPDEEPRPTPRRARVRKVDFTRPAKFSSDQERRLGRVLDTFCRTASTRLAAELRMPIELELINTAQLTWANAHAQLPEGAICATIQAKPVGTRMLLGAEQQLVLSAVERLLGGSGLEGPPPERKMTEIDQVVAQHFFTRLCTQLSAVFREAAELELELEALDGKLDSEQLAGVSEPSLAATIEVRHDRTSSTLALLLPYAAFAPFAESFSNTAHDGAGADNDPEAVQAAVSEVDVVVHAEVAAIELPIEAVLAIRPGDTLRLGGASSAGVGLVVGGVEVSRGAPGRVGPRRAVQVLSK
jgi:flagellar motor switch protein FliM